MIMSSNQQPTYAFADDAPVTNARRGKQRRARGFGIGRSKNSNKSSNSSNAASSASSEQSSYRQGGHQLSSSAARAQGAQSMSSQNSNTSNGGSSSGQKMTLNLNRRPQYSTEGWNDPPARHGSGGSGNAEDQNSCAGSLTYSASSSVQSAESSNDSSFADMIKLIDSEGEAATEIKDFIAKNSKSASSHGFGAGGGSSDPGAGSFLHGKGGGEQYVSSAAVHLYKQRMEDRSREQRAAQAHMAQAKKKKQNLNAKQLQQQAQQQQQQEQQQQQQHQFSMGAGKYHPNPNVDLNYSKDDSSEEDPFGATVDFDERVLETIGGLDRSDDDIPTRHTVTVTSQSPKSRGPQAADPFRHQDPFHPSSPYNSAPSSPRSGNNNGHVTPPPNSRQKRTSTPPGSASTVSRTSSRHSKSSSDGSFDTPAPASPPHSSSSSQGTKGSKPPHGARTPVNKARRKSPREDGKNSLALEDPSEAFYAKSWMCGFTDAFNFDGFDKNM